MADGQREGIRAAAGRIARGDIREALARGQLVASGDHRLIHPRGGQEGFEILGELRLVLAGIAQGIEPTFPVQPFLAQRGIHEEGARAPHEQVGILLREPPAEVVPEDAALHVGRRDLDESRPRERDHPPPDRLLNLHVTVGLPLQSEEGDFVQHPGRDGPPAQRSNRARETRDGEPGGQGDLLGQRLVGDHRAQERGAREVGPDVAVGDLGRARILRDERNHPAFPAMQVPFMPAEEGLVADDRGGDARVFPGARPGDHGGLGERSRGIRFASRAFSPEDALLVIERESVDRLEHDALRRREAQAEQAEQLRVLDELDDTRGRGHSRGPFSGDCGDSEAPYFSCT
jgi:hypothetical protein